MIANVGTRLENRYGVLLEFTVEKGRVMGVETCAVSESNVTVVFREDLDIKEIKYSGLFPSIGNISERDLNSYREVARTMINNFKEEHLA